MNDTDLIDAFEALAKEVRESDALKKKDRMDVLRLLLEFMDRPEYAKRLVVLARQGAGVAR